MNFLTSILRLFKEPPTQRKEIIPVTESASSVSEESKIGEELEKTILTDSLLSIHEEGPRTNFNENTDNTSTAPETGTPTIGNNEVPEQEVSKSEDSSFFFESGEIDQALNDGATLILTEQANNEKHGNPDDLENTNVGLFVTEELGSGEKLPVQVNFSIETQVNLVEEISTSLLNNRPFVKLTEECIDLMNEFEGYVERLESSEGKMIAGMVVKRFQEILERSGLQRIDDKTETFSLLRHIPVPMKPVPEGSLFNEIVTPGLALETRVLRKARVRISF
mgnify:CR=1 FL=1